MCVLRECALVQAVCVCVCVYRLIAAAGHHLWPSPPSGLLWLQIVPLGSQGLRMSEMAKHKQSPPRLDRLLCYVCPIILFCLQMQNKITTK